MNAWSVFLQGWNILATLFSVAGVIALGIVGVVGFIWLVCNGVDWFLSHSWKDFVEV